MDRHSRSGFVSAVDEGHCSEALRTLVGNDSRGSPGDDEGERDASKNCLEKPGFTMCEMVKG